MAAWLAQCPQKTFFSLRAIAYRYLTVVLFFQIPDAFEF